MSKLKIIGEGFVGALTIGVTVLLSPFLRAWYRRWGAMPDEVVRTLPGDEFVPHPKSEITAAITVHAPVQYVWPWFAQLAVSAAVGTATTCSITAVCEAQKKFCPNIKSCASAT